MFCPRLYVMSYDQKSLHENEIIKYFQNCSPGHNVLELFKQLGTIFFSTGPIHHK